MHGPPWPDPQAGKLTTLAISSGLELEKACLPGLRTAMAFTVYSGSWRKASCMEVATRPGSTAFIVTVT